MESGDEEGDVIEKVLHAKISLYEKKREGGKDRGRNRVRGIKRFGFPLFSDIHTYTYPGDFLSFSLSLAVASTLPNARTLHLVAISVSIRLSSTTFVLFLFFHRRALALLETKFDA